MEYNRFNKLEEDVFKKLPEENRKYTTNLISTIHKISALENLSGREFLLLKTAALYFYHPYELSNKTIEKDDLPKFDYDTEQVKIITNLISTNPKRTKTELEKIMCDATTEAIGKKDFLKKLEVLRIELLKMRGVTDEVPEKVRQWYSKVLKHLEEHEYFTETAKRLFQKGKEENIKKLKELLE